MIFGKGKGKVSFCVGKNKKSKFTLSYFFTHLSSRF